MSLKDALTLSPLAFLVGVAVYWLLGQAVTVPVCLGASHVPWCQAPTTWGGLPADQAPATYAIAAAVTTFVMEYVVKTVRALMQP